MNAVTPCPTTTSGDRAFRCRLHDGHPGGHLWFGCDVPDRHETSEGVES